ncbi:MAG: hypothetical protein JW388_0977 [Nitrospira sp.]|nr:hypothetical protein [Nitrospira sp.]
MSAFTDRIDRNLRGLHSFSVGACPGCDECGLAEYGDAESRESRHYQVAISAAAEGDFSWSSCDSCGSGLGGNRYPAHGVIAETMEEAQKPQLEITHFNVCVDCVMYHANGDEPDTGS